MKKIFLSLAIIGLLHATPQAQGLLNKLKSGGKEKTEDGPSTTATDEWGISGNYTFSTPWEMSGKKQKGCAINFIREENGAIVNRLEMTIAKGGDVSKFTLDEKLMNKSNIKLFKGGIYTPNYTEFEILQLDNGVLFLNCTKQKGYVVLAKNPEDLKNWDEETGFAKYEAEKKKVGSAAANAARKKLDNNETFAKYVGKVVFMPSRFEGAMGEPYPADVHKSFVTEWTPGKTMWMNAYFDKSIDEVCKTCNKKLNIVFEMGKHKVDLMQLRGSSGIFSRMSAPETFDPYSMYSGYLLWDQQKFSTAVTMVLHKNIEDGSIKPGGSLPLKVTIYAYGDKTNVAKLAEGSVSVKYNPSTDTFKMNYDTFLDMIQ